MQKGRERISSAQTEAIDTNEDTVEIEANSGDDVDSGAGEDSSRDESPRESAIRAFRELSGGKEPTEGEEESAVESTPSETDAEEEKEAPKKLAKLPTEEESPKKQAKVTKQAGDVDPDALDPELQPPERLQAKEKLLFNNLPKGLKRALHRVVKDVEAGGSQVVQHARKEAAEVQSIKEAVAPFVGDWADRGFTVSQGILSLARAQQKLTDPKTRLQTYIALGKDLGIEPDHITQHLSGQGAAVASQQDLTSHPEFRALQQTTQQLTSRLEQQNLHEATRPIVEEMNAVRHEVDQATGQLRYPELHDEMYLESLKTRVSEIVANDPQVGFGQALLKANAERKQQLFGFSQQPSLTTRTQPAQSTNNRVQAAAVSVRGRVGTGIKAGNGAEPPPEALKSPAATTRWVLENLRRGTIS